jgi:hypothetical protein
VRWKALSCDQPIEVMVHGSDLSGKGQRTTPFIRAVSPQQS